ncbi:MAG: hypothetical protein IPK92_11000 [Nitrospira sp.]|jgi:hypothetical protein|nr:hypothetical protein [Nitrospira sp.]
MPLEERSTFIWDDKPDMTFEEKNRQLSAELGIAPNSKRKIVRIDRIEIGGAGWRITYRVGTPN